MRSMVDPQRFRWLKWLVLGILTVASLLGCQALESDTESAVTREMLLGRWQIKSLAGSPVESNSRAYLEFSESPRLTGSGGCNRFFGTYRYDNQTLEIGSAMGSTKMACAAQTMAQEQHLFRLLPDAVHAELEEVVGEQEAGSDRSDTAQQAELVLRDETGRVLVTAVRKPEAQR